MMEFTRNIDSIIIGAHKCATTSLYRTLIQHPAIYAHSGDQMPAVFENDDYAERYRAFFAEEYSSVNKEQHLFAREMNLYTDSNYLQRLKDVNPNVKLIFIIRDPVERAFSSFQYSRNNAFNQDSGGIDKFIEQWRSGARRDNDPINSHIEMGFFGNILERITSIFSQDNILVVNLSNFSLAPKEEANRIFIFLGIEPFEVNPIIANVRSSNRSVKLHQYVRDSNGILKKLVRKLLSRRLRHYLFRAFLFLNRKKEKKSVLSIDASNQLVDIYRADMYLLKTKYGIDYLSRYEN